LEEQFKAEKKSPYSMDIMAFWRGVARSSSRHSHLWFMEVLARKYLGLMVSNVGCESFFSLARNILIDCRTRLTATTFRRLAIMKANQHLWPPYFTVDNTLLAARGVVDSVVVDLSSEASASPAVDEDNQPEFELDNNH
jgi:hAT family C-terminal dimerisation region